MNRPTDQQLLGEYAEKKLESAFTELAHRHLDFVDSAALRLVCDPIWISIQHMVKVGNEWRFAGTASFDQRRWQQGTTIEAVLPAN